MITFTDDEIDLFAQTILAGYFSDNPGNPSADWAELSQLQRGNWRRAARAMIRHIYHGQPAAKAPDELSAIARENREAWAGKRLVAIVEDGGWWSVHMHTADSVHPAMTYATPQEAVARVMQLLQTGPVDPQSWPERVCIGRIE